MMRFPGYSIALLGLLLAGCAGQACRAPVGDRSLTPSLVAAARGHQGELVQWGGVLVETRNFSDRTELEVIGYPLDACGRLQTGAGQTGRFIVVRPGYLETADYQAGRRVSAAGRITGFREGHLGGGESALPLLESHQVQLWPEERSGEGYYRPWFSIGIGGGSSSGVFGGVGVTF